MRLRRAKADPGRLWVVGRDDGRGRWFLVGVFSGEQVALQHCRTANHFIGPAALDVAFPEEVTDWPGAYYPLR